MKAKQLFLLLVMATVVLVMGFVPAQEKKPVYLYAFAWLSKSKTYVYTPVITCWYSKGGYTGVTTIMKTELRSRLEKYIEGEMGLAYQVSYAIYSNKRTQAEDWRLESMAKDRKNGYGIGHTGIYFSYRYEED